MEIQSAPLALDILRISCALGNGLVLAAKLSCGVTESFASLEIAAPVFALQSKIPILREVLRLRETLFLRRHAPISAGEIG